MLIRLACDAYKAVSCMCFPLLSIGVGLCFGGELDGEGALGVGVGVEGARDDVEHAVLAIADEGVHLTDRGAVFYDFYIATPISHTFVIPSVDVKCVEICAHKARVSCAITIQQNRRTTCARI